MDKWEYNYYVREITPETYMENTHQFRIIMGEYGDEGWELVSSNTIFKIPERHVIEFWFKRKLKS